MGYIGRGLPRHALTGHTYLPFDPRITAPERPIWRGPQNQEEHRSDRLDIGEQNHGDALSSPGAVVGSERARGAGGDVVTVGGIAGGLFVCFGVVLLVRQAALVWTGSDHFRNYVSGPPGFPVPQSVWKYYVHTMPTLAVASVLFAVTALFAAIANGPVTVAFALLCALSVFVVAPLVFVFNAPKAFVPPRLRAEDGWIESWRK
jgi:hypothetical protein